MSRATQGLVRVVIDSVDWAGYEVAGPPLELAARLVEFVSEDSLSERPRLWDSMENYVFLQDDIVSAAEPAISVLFAALVDGLPLAVKIPVLDLIFHLVHAASLRVDDLGRRCIDRATEGVWLLVGTASLGPAAVTDACVEILQILSPERALYARPRN